MTGEPARPSDAEVRDRVRRIFDHLLFAEIDVCRRRTDPDGLWAVPGDLADYGDGTGLMAIGEQQLIKPMREALDRADRELRALRDEVEADKRRRIGPGYRPAKGAGASRGAEASASEVEEEPRDRLARHVRERRIQLRLSARAASAKAGVDRATWASMEKGTRRTAEYQYTGIEYALDWTLGSIDAILDGGEPTVR